jgi:hypothetical protein
VSSRHHGTSSREYGVRSRQQAPTSMEYGVRSRRASGTTLGTLLIMLTYPRMDHAESRRDATLWQLIGDYGAMPCVPSWV